MDATRGAAAAGQLKPLMRWALDSVNIDNLESGDGVAILKVDSLDMPQNVVGDVCLSCW